MSRYILSFEEEGPDDATHWALRYASGCMYIRWYKCTEGGIWWISMGSHWRCVGEIPQGVSPIGKDMVPI